MSMKSLCTSIVCLGLATASIGQEASGWREVSPGLYRLLRTSHGVRSVAYRTNTPFGREKLHQLLARQNPAALQIMLRDEKGFRPRLMRAGSGTCSMFGSGYSAVDNYQLNIRVDCDPDVQIHTSLVVQPAPNDNGGYATKDSDGAGFVSDMLSHSCTPPYGNSNGTCGSGAESNPEDWATGEYFTTDQGDEGYECQAGDDYPYACPYGGL